jgi:hypothetical protein
MLLGGVLAGPLYLAVGLIQAFVRDGFDLARHSLSMLANGPGGWVQTANFAVSGLMVLAAAVGFWRTPGPRLRAPASFLAAFGVSLLAAAVFPADPLDGFPPGTPEGLPATISPTGMAHFGAGTLGFVSWAVSALLVALAMRRQAGWLAALSLLGGLAVVLGFFGGFFLPSPVAGIWLAVVVGWAWLTTTSLYLRRAAAP